MKKAKVELTFDTSGYCNYSKSNKILNIEYSKSFIPLLLHKLTHWIINEPCFHRGLLVPDNKSCELILRRTLVFLNV